MTRILAILLLVTPAHAGTSPSADLGEPSPLCVEMEAALELPPLAFADLHPDAFAQFRGMVLELCGTPDDARSWAILRAWADGPDAVVEATPVPLPPTITALLLGWAGLGIIRRVK